MRVLRLDRTSEGFYEILGPVFGSRTVEQATHDRFYDDPGKVWYCVLEQGAASVLGITIKNFWAANDECAEELLREILRDTPGAGGIVPCAHAEVFEKLGFSVSRHRKNFIEVRHEKN